MEPNWAANKAGDSRRRVLHMCSTNILFWNKRHIRCFQHTRDLATQRLELRAGRPARPRQQNKKHAGLWLRTAPGPKLGSDSEHGNTHTHTHTHNSPTLIFSAMISGSSHIDSTKKTCAGEMRSWSRVFLFFLFFFFLRFSSITKEKRTLYPFSLAKPRMTSLRSAVVLVASKTCRDEWDEWPMNEWNKN